MKLTPNLSPAMRVVYVLLGIGLIAVPLLTNLLEKPLPLVVGLLGAASIVEGAGGF